MQDTQGGREGKGTNNELLNPQSKKEATTQGR